MARNNMGQRPIDPQELCDQRKSIVESIRCIRVEPFKTFRQVEVSESTNSTAKTFVKSAPNVYGGNYLRYNVLYSLDAGCSIYELLARDAGEATVLQADQKFQDWEEALNHLRRYALNLLLAPRRPEFQSIKLYSSFYVYQVAKKLNGADQILMAMGYRVPGNRSTRGADELRIEGEVDLNLVANAAADLVILQHDLKLLKGIAKSIVADYPQAKISEILEARSIKEQTYRDTYDKVVAWVRSRLMPSQQTSPTRNHIQKRSNNYDDLNPGYDGNHHMEQERPNYNPESYASSNTPKRPNTIFPNRNGPLIARSAQIEQKNPVKVLTQHDSAPLLDIEPQRQPEVTEPHSDSFSTPGRSKRQTYKKSGSEGSLLDRVNSDGGGRPSPWQPLHKEGMWEDQPSNHSSSGGVGPHEYAVGSPSNLEESFSVISNIGCSPPPNPEDLPEPVFSSEAAVENNMYERHLRYSYSGSNPWFSPELSPYVEEDPYKPLQPLQPDPNYHPDLANSEEAVRHDSGCVGGGDSTSAHSDRHPDGSAGEDDSTVAYATVMCHNASQSSHLRAGKDDSRVAYSTVIHSDDTSQHSRLSNKSDTSKSSHHPDDTSQHSCLSNKSDTSKSSLHPDESVNGRGAPNGVQHDSQERLGSGQSSSKIPQHYSVLVPPKSSKPRLQGKGNSDSSSVDKCVGHQSHSNGGEAQHIGKTSSKSRQDLGTYYDETELDNGFLSIDLVVTGRPRASHISEPSKVDYQDKLKVGKAREDDNPAKINDSPLKGSDSESNLDFKQRTERSSSWICDYCTFINSDTDECEVCGILRKSN